MKIAIRCTELQQEEWLLKPHMNDVQYVFFEKDSINFFEAAADVFFDLLFDASNTLTHTLQQPVFVNEVIATCSELPANHIRINAWNGFLKREITEIAASEEQYLLVDEIMNTIGWKYQIVPDEPGMIAPRIISMIVNEAYFGLEDDISTKEAIDTAMKLGTNYPLGPFEWSEKIGLQNIYFLLKKLSLQDTRYTPSKLLKESVFKP